MSLLEIPSALRRHRNRPLRWALGLAAFVAYVLTYDARVLAAEQRQLDTGLRVDGTVARSYRGGATVPVEYHNPLTDQTVVAEVYVTGGRFLPRGAGEKVELVVTREDPDIAFMAGDRTATLSTDFPMYLVLVGTPILLWLARLVGTARARRLARSDKPTFAMLGALGPRSRFGRHCELHLYPLDGPPGSPSVCAVPLATTGGIALGESFAVEVKGVPRPMGRVVARVGDEVLWPAGRARPLARLPRPAAQQEAPVWPPDRSADPPHADALATTWWGALWPHTLGLAAAAALVVGVAVVTLLHAADADELRRNGKRVIAEVVEHAGSDDRLVLKYRVSPDSREVQGRVTVDFASEWTVGRRYPAVVDPADPSRVELLGEPYDAIEPIEWATMPLPFAVAVFLGGVGARRRQRRLAETAGWRTAWAWPMGDALFLPLVAVGRHRGAPTAVVRVSSGDLAWLGRGGGRYTQVRLAGEPWPGEVLVLAHHDRLFLPSGRALAPREGDLDTAYPGWPPTPEPPPQEGDPPERCRSLPVASLWALALAQVGFLAGLALGIALEALGVAGAATVCGAVGAALVAVRCLLISATDDGTALTVRNALRTYRIPWDDVVRFRLRSPWYLKGGGIVTVQRRHTARDVPVLVSSDIETGRHRRKTFTRWARRHGIPSDLSS